MYIFYKKMSRRIIEFLFVYELGGTTVYTIYTCNPSELFTPEYTVCGTMTTK